MTPEIKIEPRPLVDRPKERRERGFRRVLVLLLGKAAGNFFWFCLFQFFINWWMILACLGLASAGIASLFGCTVNIPEWMKHPLQTVWRNKDHLPGAEAIELADAKARKLAEEHRAHRMVSARAEADALHMPWKEVWPLEKLEVELSAHREKLREAARREQQRIKDEEKRVAEEARKQPLYARADKIGLKVDPRLDYHSFKEQVEQAEAELAADAAYQAAHRKWEDDVKKWDHDRLFGPNAKCMNPRCDRLFKFDDAQDYVVGKEHCPKCRLYFWRSQAKEHFKRPPRPEEPTPPRKNPGLLWGLFQ